MKNIYYLILVLLVVVACGTKEKAEEVQLTPEQELSMRISIIESDLKEEKYDAEALPIKVKGLIKLYGNYAKDYPKDSLAPLYLLRASDLSFNTQRYNNALACYDTLIVKYPDYDKVPMVMYLKASMLDFEMGKKDEARAAYEAYINKYPKDQFVDEAKARLADTVAFNTENLEDLIRHFEEKNNVN